METKASPGGVNNMAVSVGGEEDFGSDEGFGGDESFEGDEGSFDPYQGYDQQYGQSHLSEFGEELSQVEEQLSDIQQPPKRRH